MEADYLVEIEWDEADMGGIYNKKKKKRNNEIAEKQKVSTPLNMVKAYLTVNASFGFTADFRSKTPGKTFPQCVFDQWEVIPVVPLGRGKKAKEIMMEARKRKGLKEAIPVLGDFLEKL
eukprot:TRINITY_DN11435_c0_g1_i1.p1 TRINITY_DN11435_c0_g1~~TRINITY_DN11435_c0_g1_i1.p1  ORF type:complete len:119 (+),score=36.84 TRINITY_DN11435_c0_g1_i1:57-413(+)